MMDLAFDAAPPPEAPFVSTSVARTMARAVARGRQMGWNALVVGAPGIGKAALRQALLEASGVARELRALAFLFGAALDTSPADDMLVDASRLVSDCMTSMATRLADADELADAKVAAARASIRTEGPADVG